MKDTVTYSLIEEHVNSNQYYMDIADLADEVLLNGKSSIYSVIAASKLQHDMIG